MSEEELQVIRKEVMSAVGTMINGKFDPLSPTYILHGVEDKLTEIENSMKEIRPFLDMYRGGKVLGGILKWVGGVATAVILLWGFFHGGRL